jgi:LysR family transcriptional regulator (chromosome initiation inhibitor)
MDVTLDQLRTLAAVVDEGTFDGASVALRVTPSAISQRIKAWRVPAGGLGHPDQAGPADPTRVAMLRLARTTTRLAQDTAREIGVDTRAGYATLPIAVNADSLATWFLSALARLPARHLAVFDVHVDDQDRTFDPLPFRVGTRGSHLGGPPDARMHRDHPGVDALLRLRAPDFVDAWFPEGLTHDAMAEAPLVVFNRKDTLQHRFIGEVSGAALAPPTHYLPASADFVRGIQLGLGGD